MASLKDVAKLANVSLMTVSRALNTPERLKPETLARVQAAIAETNYVPDLSAKKIRGARATPSTIGVLALDTVTTPFSVEITLSIEETARAHGWNSFVVNMFSDDRPEAVVDLLLSHRPDGIIFTTMGLRQVPLPDKLLTLPCVLANCESLSQPVASYIPDDEQGQYDAVKALLSMAIRAAKKQGKYVGICGQGPSDHEDFAAWLMEEGIDSLSLNPDTVVQTWLSLAELNK